MHGGNLVNRDNNRDRHQAVTVGTRHNAVVTCGQLHGRRILTLKPLMIGQDLQQVPLGGAKLVAGVLPRIVRQVRAQWSGLEGREYHQRSLADRNRFRPQRRSHGDENQRRAGRSTAR